MQGKITASSLNVRKSSSTTSAVVKTLSQDTIVNIVSSKKVGATTWYKIKEGWISGKYVSILSDKNEIIITPNMTMKQIQDCLKKSGYTIKFTKGTYNITKTLYLYSDTKIILDSAILVRKNSRQIFTNYLNPDINYNYNATKNVTISGNGILRGDGNNKICSTISIMHCDNFKIEGITFENTYKSHGVDICGCSNMILNNIKFKDRINNPKALYKEELNLDYSYYGGFPYYPKGSKCFNNNHCKNITFEGLIFNNINVCIGNHYDHTKLKHKNIIINKCTANGKAVNNIGYFVKLINVDGLTLKNNKTNLDILFDKKSVTNVITK